MAITSIHRRASFLQVFATIARRRFEFVSRDAGAFEVYDYPASWNGVPRYVGTMGAETSAKLRRIAREHEATSPQYWQMYNEGLVA